MQMHVNKHPLALAPLPRRRLGLDPSVDSWLFSVVSLLLVCGKARPPRSPSQEIPIHDDQSGVWLSAKRL